MPKKMGAKPSKYLLGLEHLTDREIDELYNLVGELKLQIDRFREYDKRYRALELITTKSSETERANILNACLLMTEKTAEMLGELKEITRAVGQNFLKAKGALEEKIEMEN